MPVLKEEDLPAASLETEGAIAICDPYQGSLSDARIFCHDGLDLGLRALRTVMSSVDRLYLSRPACQPSGCTEVELGTATVTGWQGEFTLGVVVETDHGWVTMPTREAAVGWPQRPVFQPPPLKRPTIDGAPPEVRDRELHAFCGRFGSDSGAERGCFVDAIIAGVPVEMIQISSINGDPIVWRFDGDGLVIRYGEYHRADGSSRGWHRAVGPLSITGWAFENDSEGERIR